MSITVRGDRGYSCPAFCRLVDKQHLCFVLSVAGNANFLRLLVSCLAYKLFLLLKQAIPQTTVTSAYRWQIDTIRSRLLKVGATIRKTNRRIYYCLPKAFVRQELFRQLIAH
ncbi:MAG: transposase [Balneolaceae bacterium]